MLYLAVQQLRMGRNTRTQGARVNITYYDHKLKKVRVKPDFLWAIHGFFAGITCSMLIGLIERFA
ncbi:MAG: hypothetical protein JWR16_3313 [Nevskia sp.]|nr:hypothetical protein [Nevskia sp.]